MKGKIMQKLLIVFGLIVLVQGCAVMAPEWKRIELTNDEYEIVRMLNIEDNTIKKLMAKPLYQFSENELDQYLGYLQLAEPDIRARIQHLAQKNVNQPYQMFLLGEFPVEIYDPEPLYSLKKSDCVVFSEHIYAMGLSYNWESFFAMLQRIRYRNGEISLVTRNHYTEYDWDRNNSWLVEDVTEQLAGQHAVGVTSIIDKARFFQKWNIAQMIPADTFHWHYIPFEHVVRILDQLQPGDFVNVVRGSDDGTKWVGHVGLITRSPEGIVNFLHSTPPRVIEEPLMHYIEKNVRQNDEKQKQNLKIREDNLRLSLKKPDKPLEKPLPYFYGFKFLRLREDPIWELIKIDGLNAPKVSIPTFY